jgi:DNA-binding transcriptional LysR family regulator
MVAVRIRSNLRFAVIGSPAYFEKHGVPSTPHNLNDRVCIHYAFPNGTILQWEFQANGEFIHLEVDGTLTVDSQELMVDAASRGIGLAYVWERRAESCLRDGRRVSCLEDGCPLEENIFLYFPSRQHQLRACARRLMH